jgi:hypothetical protein
MQILSEGLSFLLAVTTMTKKHTLSLHKPRHIFACSTLNIQLQNNTHKLQIPQVKDILIFCIHTLPMQALSVIRLATSQLMAVVGRPVPRALL